LGKIIEGYRINIYSSSQDIAKDEPLEVRYRFKPEGVRESGVKCTFTKLKMELDDGYDTHLDKNLNKAIYFLDHRDGWTLWGAIDQGYAKILSEEPYEPKASPGCMTAIISIPTFISVYYLVKYLLT